MDVRQAKVLAVAEPQNKGRKIMDTIAGLKEYVQWKGYREKLHLPEQQTEEYILLAQGEYNRNYLFTHPDTRKKLVLRVNCGSQMHLEHQIQYEYDALCQLSGSGRTPLPIYVDDSRERLAQGVLVMEYLPGRALSYTEDLDKAADCLAEIHSTSIERPEVFIAPDNPGQAILKECEEMFSVYEHAPQADAKTAGRIRRMLDKGWEGWETVSFADAPRCCVNTELNSTNFLVEKNRAFLVDWEKPLWSDPAQDLGHFLAPTTTFWKTDIILKREDIRHFLACYKKGAAGSLAAKTLEERVDAFLRITCLRGITWCAMAWVQYQNRDKLLYNVSTARKLEQYLEDSFLEIIEKGYIDGINK